MNSVVIARYNESLDWIVGIPREFEIYLYNKGEAITDPAILARANHIIDRPNVGRESETYIHHMLTRVQPDRSYTVFAQGDPFEHSPDFLKLLEGWREWDDLEPLTWQWRPDSEVPPTLTLNTYAAQLNGRPRVRPEHFSLMTWNPTSFFDEGAYGTSVDYRKIHGDLPVGTNIAAHFLRLARLDALADKAQRHQFGIFCYGAIFAVRNDRVRALPTENLALLYEATKAAMTYGYVLERIWLHLFGAEFILPVFAEKSASQVVPAAARVVSLHPAQPAAAEVIPAVAAKAPEVAPQGMTNAEKVAVTGMVNSLTERVNDRDFYMISSAWRYHGADKSVLDFFELKAKAPMMWSEIKPDFWLIYICTLLESGQNDLAGRILRTYRFYHGDKLIENYLPIVSFALQNGVANESVKKAAFVNDCFSRNQADNLLARTLQGKSVAIVGNGPSEMGKGRGAKIDQHDIVIRFNNYATRGFERDYGTKTDIWVRGGGGDDVIDRTDVSQYKLVMWEADYQHFPIHFNHLNIMHRYLQSNPRKCAYFDFETHYTLREECGIPFPSTGLVTYWTIFNMIGKGIDDVSLYGFAALEANPVFNHPHYFEKRDEADAKERSNVHCPVNEAAFMRHLMRLSADNRTNLKTVGGG